MLHILNGGSTEETMKRSSLEGEYFSFRDALIDGPAPATTDSAAWRRVRAEHLAGGYGADVQQCETDLSEQEHILNSYSSHDEVVLWFEHDVFCQLNLLYLLDWYHRANLGQTRLSLINIGEFPGRNDFRGIGELNPQELASLFPKRQLVSKGLLDLGARAWQAYCSSNPNSIEQLLSHDTSELPFLATALTAHLQRFPSVTNGLGRIENRCLELVATGPQRFIDLFPRFIESESVYGLGDAQIWTSLGQLRDARTPLLTADTDAKFLTPGLLWSATFSITTAGRDVLQNRADYLDHNEIDVWLGGAHLHTGAPIWRWDDTSGKLQSTS
jgi:hypothetical protein